MTPNTEDPDIDTRKPLAERLRDRGKSALYKKPVPVLRKLIETRHVLSRLRQDGMSSEGLAQLFESEGIHVTSGTVRNYRAQIDRAVAALEADGNGDPTIDDIHRMFIVMAKTSRGTAPQPPGRPSAADTTQTPKTTVASGSSLPVRTERPRGPGKLAPAGHRDHETKGTFAIRPDRDNL